MAKERKTWDIKDVLSLIIIYITTIIYITFHYSPISMCCGTIVIALYSAALIIAPYYYCTL